MMNMKTWAGKFKSKEECLLSASGGACTAISEAFIHYFHGVVLGTSYSDDYKEVIYRCVRDVSELNALRGSKYVSCKKIVRQNGNDIPLFLFILDLIRSKKHVLFIGLGCDVYLLQQYIKNNLLDNNYLYTIELICDGPTYHKIHEQYVEHLEEVYESNIVDFTTRDKNYGWENFCLRARFENGETHIRTFYDSDYGFAFRYAKMSKCYSCRFKGENHCGDLIVGDFWGIRVNSNIDTQEGVSLIVERGKKGSRLIGLIDCENFLIWEESLDEAIKSNIRFSSHPIESNITQKYHELLKNMRLHEAVMYVEHFDKEKHFPDTKNTIVWGIGKSFEKNYPKIKEMMKVDYVVDGRSDNWGKIIDTDLECVSPRIIMDIKDPFVVITVDNIKYAFDIVHELIKMNVYSFDIVDNWMRYAGNFILEDVEE